MAQGNFIQEKIMPAAGKMQNNTYVSAITQGMMGTMPVLMGGAVLQLFYSFPITAWQTFLQNIGLYQLLTTCVDIFNLTAIYMAFAIGKTLAEKKGVDAFQGGVITLLCFLLVTPLTTDANGSTAILTSYLGAQGVFTAMIVALIAPSIFAWVVKKNWVLQLPPSVPNFVADSFKMVPPAFLTVIPFIALRGAFGMTSYASFTGFIYAILQAPLTGVGNTLGGHLILIVVCCLLWWCGIHGTLVVITMLIVLTQPALLENIAAVNAGQAAPHLLSYMTIFCVLQFLGGPGCLFGLYVNMLRAKSERFKAQGKISFIPGMFNIIEPTVYGLPICLNPILLIPFVLTPVIVYILMYLCLTIGIFTTPTVNLAVMVMPGPIVGFLLGGGPMLGVFMIAMCALSCVIYYPFFKVLDNQALEQEKQIAAQQAAEAETAQ